MHLVKEVYSIHQKSYHFNLRHRKMCERQYQASLDAAILNLAKKRGRYMANEFLIRKKVHFPFLQGREFMTGKDH